jgi:hypothetical protein
LFNIVILVFCFTTLVASDIGPDITFAIELMRSPETETATEIKSKIETKGKESSK